MTPQANGPTIRITGILEWGLGVTRGKRFRVEIGGQAVGLPDTEFRLITVLALARSGMLRTGPAADPTGWVHEKHLLIPAEHARMYFSRLKKHIRRQFDGFPDWPVYATSPGGWYRIVSDRSHIAIDHKTLVICPLRDIARVVKRARLHVTGATRDRNKQVSTTTNV